MSDVLLSTTAEVKVWASVQKMAFLAEWAAMGVLNATTAEVLALIFD